MLAHYQTQGLRFILAASSALMFTFLILLFMRSLIGNNDIFILDHTKRIPMTNFIRVPVIESEPPVREHEKPDKVSEQPPVPEFSEGDKIDSDVFVTLSPGPGIDVGPEKFPPPLINSELVTVVDMPPVYPQKAITKNIEGYVIVEFTVTATGSTTDIAVLDASPENIFNRSAIKAASKSRFKPKLVEGKAVAVSGIRKKYTFEFTD